MTENDDTQKRVISNNSRLEQITTTWPNSKNAA
jgi:hypothetical protein